MITVAPMMKEGGLIFYHPPPFCACRSRFRPLLISDLYSANMRFQACSISDSNLMQMQVVCTINSLLCSFSHDAPGSRRRLEYDQSDPHVFFFHPNGIAKPLGGHHSFQMWHRITRYSYDIWPPLLGSGPHIQIGGSRSAFFWPEEMPIM